MAYGSAEFIGPTPAQLAQNSNKDFQDAMTGMAGMFAEIARQKQTQASAKAAADLAAQQENVKNSLSILDAAQKATITGSINELAGTPEGQAVIASTYKTMGMSDEQVKNILGLYSSNPYSADQIHAQLLSRAMSGAQGQAAGAGEAPAASASQRTAPASSGVVPGTVAEAPTAAQAATPAAPAPVPAAAQPGAGIPVPFPNAGLPAAAPAPAPPFEPLSAPKSAQQARAQQVAGAQARAGAAADIRLEARNMDPALAGAFLQQALAPDSLYLQAKAFEKDPNKFMEDTNPDNIAKVRASTAETLANAQKIGLENNKAIKDLANYDETYSVDTNYKKALTLQALKNAAAATINAKIASASYQTNNMMLSKLVTDAQAITTDLTTAVATAKKAGKVTANDIASWNSMITRANATYDQANRIALNMQLSLGGNPKEVAQFQHMGFYTAAQAGAWDQVGNFFTGLLSGEGNKLVTPVQQAPEAQGTPAASGGGIGTPQKTTQTTVQTGGSTGATTVPSDYDKAMQEAGFGG